MFLDHINPRLFSPLASPNARAYGIGLWALYNRLVIGQLDGDECTPKEARDIIRRELIMQHQQVDWSADTSLDATLLPENETDDASRIYRYLRDCGWLMEMDDIGYRRITYFPQIASRLLSALNSISGVRAATIGATCQGVYTALLAAQNNPAENASQIEFAAKASRDFYSELSNIAASSREVLHRMNTEKAGPGLFHLFFKDFMQDIVLGDYSTIKTQSHPYRYRATTLSVIVDISRSSTTMDALVEATARASQNSDRDEINEQLNKDLNDIYRIFEGIDNLLNRIDHYRSTMTRRTREAMQYAYKAIPDIGQRLGKLVGNLSSIENSEELLLSAPFVNDHYLAPQRAYTPKKKAQPAEETSIIKTDPPIEDIAKSRAYDSYMHKRAENPERIIQFVERHLRDKVSITTSDLKIECLDDFLAYIQLRDLLHDAIPSNSVYIPLLKYYQVSPVRNKITVNDYLTAPELLIYRRSLPPKQKGQNDAA